MKSREDLFCLVFHEILHPVFGHFVYEADRLSNLAGDAAINAVISLLYAKESGEGRLFRRFYEPKGHAP